MKKRLPKSSFVLATFACIGVLIACGPYFAPRILSYRSTVVEIPTTGIDLMFLKNKKASDAQRHYRQLPERRKATFNADIADLKKAAPALDAKIFAKYSMIRRQMIMLNQWNEPFVNEQSLAWLDDEVQKALPEEFALYHAGAVAYRSNLIPKARELWLALLNLPPAERKYRSVWAAWMLARSSSADGGGTRWYKKVLELKQAGFPDSLGVTEKDWTHYFAYRSGDYVTALSGYIEDGKNNKIDAMEAARSIERVFNFALNREVGKGKLREFYKLIAKHKELSIAFSYFIKSYVSPSGYTIMGKFPRQIEVLNQWVEELNQAERKDKDRELGINAMTAYKLRADGTLQRCISRMSQPTIDSLWLKAKRETMEGNLKEAAGIYLKLTQMIQSEEGEINANGYDDYRNFLEAGEVAQRRLFWLYSEYASVELGLKKYSNALDLFLKVNNLSDAAYIAETIMSPTELLHHVRSSEVAKNSQWLKKLLFRKLMRNEYFKDAKSFILEEHIKKYEQYTTLYRFGINEKNSKLERSRALEKAAYLLEREGHSMVSLENNARPFSRIYAAGMQTHSKYDYSQYMEKDQPVIPSISRDELARIKKNYIRISPIRVTVMQAAELLYRSAILLPRNDDHAAKLLWTAGDWTRSDPQIADKYYQALVRRCWNTKLGKACDKRRWFISNMDDF